MLALGKRRFGLQTQAMRRKVNGIAEVFDRITFYHKRHSHMDPPTFRPAID